MAMIKCRECGKEISSRAEACPHCGAKTRFGREEAEKKQLTTASVIWMLLSAVGTILFVTALLTMMGDISDYHNSWYGGYNYKSPLSDHEMGVVMRLIVGIALDIGGAVGFIKAKKDMENQQKRHRGFPVPYFFKNILVICPVHGIIQENHQGGSLWI